MMFSREQQMVKPAVSWLKAQGLMVKHEFPMPWGICDLVGCSFNKQNVMKRLALGQKKPIGSHLRVMLLMEIPEQEDNQHIVLSDLVKRFGEFLDEQRIYEELNRLENHNFICRTSTGSFYKVNGWMPLHKRILALELKLSRVQDAFYQAVSNLEFADESYVGLPMDVAGRLITSKRAEDFVETGIGILGLKFSSYKIFLKARFKGSEANETLKNYCAERFWRTILKTV